MAKYGFLDVLEDELDRHFQYDYEINWNKKQHAVEVSFLLEAENKGAVATLDEDDCLSQGDILLEESIIFYNAKKSSLDLDDYLAAFPFEAKKGLSKEFLHYLVLFLNETAHQGLDDLQDFLDDDQAESFAVRWNQSLFDSGLSEVNEKTFFPYPRY